MHKLFAIIMLTIMATATVIGQDQKSEPKNYVEVRGSSLYQFGEYTKTIGEKTVVDLYYIRTGGQDQGFAGVGRTFKLGNAGTMNTLIYGIVGSHGQFGVMPALLIPSLQKGRVKTTAFLGWFIPIKGEVHQYLVIDSWDTTAETTKKLDIGVSIGFFLQDGKWNQKAGPMARLNLDKLGSWTISERFGPGGKELRFARTFSF